MLQQNVTSIVGCRSRTITLLTSDAAAKIEQLKLNVAFLSSGIVEEEPRLCWTLKDTMTMNLDLGKTILSL